MNPILRLIKFRLEESVPGGTATIKGSPLKLSTRPKGNITQWPLSWETWILLFKFSHMKKIRGLGEMTLILSRYKLPSLYDMAGETKVGRDFA